MPLFAITIAATACHLKKLGCFTRTQLAVSLQHNSRFLSITHRKVSDTYVDGLVGVW